MARTRSLPRLWILAAAMILAGACILESAAGPTPTPQVIVVPGDGEAPSTPSTYVAH